MSKEEEPPTSSNVTPPEEYGLVPAEVNLEEAPLWTMKGRNRQEGTTSATHTVTTPDGRELHSVWKVTADREHELPGPFDQDVYVAVLSLVERRGGMPADGRIGFSLYEVIDVLGIAHKGTNYKKVRDSLERVASTTIRSDNAFYSKDTENYETETFSLWRVKFSESRSKGRKADRHTLVFDEILVRSFQARYLKGLDTDFYYSLNVPLARRLYRLIDQQRAGTSRWSVSLKRLRELASMAPSYQYPSKIKEALQPAHAELKRSGYLEDASYEEQVVHYEVAANFARESENGIEDSTQKLAVSRMVSQGVWANVARNLVSRFGAEYCLRYADLLPFQPNVEYPGPYLKTAIEQGWDLVEPGELPQSSQEQAPSLFDDQKLSSDHPLPPDAGDSFPEPDESARELWLSVLEELEEISTTSPRMWFEGVVPSSLQDGVLTLSAPGPEAKAYIDSRFKQEIEQVLTSRDSPFSSLRVESRI